MNKIRIGDHIKIIPGFPFNSTHFNTDGEGLPLIRIRNLLTSKIETFYKGEYPDEFVIDEDDILIGMDGDFHVVKWKNKRKALLNQRIMKVAQKEGAKINIDYFFYFLFPFLKDVWEKTAATTVKHLSTYDVSDAEVDFPEFELQSQIAKILSTCDSVIEKTQAAIAKYKAIKQGMLHDLFTRGIDLQTGKLRLKYEDAPELYRESKLGLFPKEWEEKKILNVANVNGRVGWKGYTVGDLRDSGPLVLGASQIDNSNKLDLSKPIYLSIEKYLESPEIMIAAGDVLLVQRGNTIGKIVIIDREIGEATINPSMVLLNNIRGDNFFLYYQLCSFICQRQIELLTSHTGVPMISQEQIANIKIVVPFDPKESVAIANRIKTIDSCINTEINYLQKLQQLKAGLMGDLLSGKKEVKVMEELAIQNQN